MKTGISVTKYRRNPAIEAAPLQQELMLFNAASKKFCVLNSTAAAVWQLLETPRTSDELSDALRDQFETSGAAHVEQDVQAVLKQLEDLDLVAMDSHGSR